MCSDGQLSPCRCAAMKKNGVGDAVQVVGKPGEDLTVLRVARALQALL